MNGANQRLQILCNGKSGSLNWEVVMKAGVPNSIFKCWYIYIL